MSLILYVMSVMFNLAAKLVKKNGKGIDCVMFTFPLDKIGGGSA